MILPFAALRKVNGTNTATDNEDEAAKDIMLAELLDEFDLTNVDTNLTSTSENNDSEYELNTDREAMKDVIGQNSYVRLQVLCSHLSDLDCIRIDLSALETI